MSVLGDKLMTATDGFLSDPLLSDAHSKVRGRALVLASFGCGGITLLLGLARGATSGWADPLTIILISGGLLISLSPMLLRKAKNLRRVGLIMPGIASAILVTMALAEDGLNSEALFWMPFAPFVVAYFSGKRAAIGLGAALAIALGWIYIAMAMELGDADQQKAFLKFIAIVGALGFGVILAVTYESLQARAAEQLADQHRRSESIMRALPDLVVVMNSAAEVTSVSRPATVGRWSDTLRWYGPRDRRKSARHVTDVFPDVDAERLRQQIQAAREQEDLAVIEEYELLLGDDSRTIEVRATATQGDQVIAVVRDVTRIRRMTDARMKYIETVIHQIREPVAAISSSLKLIRGGVLGDMSDQVSEFIERADNNATRLTEMVDDLLDVELLEENRLTLAQETFRLNNLLSGCISRHADEAARAQVELQLEEGPSGSEAIGDPKRVSQVITKLLSNAIRVTGAGGRVIVRGGRSDVHAWIQIIDRGPGIPDELRDKLFTRFEGLKPITADSAEESSGLGMYLANKLIREMGGEISFMSRPNEGTTFTVSLPRPDTRA